MNNETNGARRPAAWRETLARVRLLATQGAITFGDDVPLEAHDFVAHALEHATSCLVGPDDVHVRGPTVNGASIRVAVLVGDVIHVREILAR
jgi:hypothetical protein